MLTRTVGIRGPSFFVLKQTTNNPPHTTNNKHQTTHNKQQTTHNKQHTTNKQQTTHNTHQTTNNKIPVFRFSWAFRIELVISQHSRMEIQVLHRKKIPKYRWQKIKKKTNMGFVYKSRDIESSTQRTHERMVDPPKPMEQEEIPHPEQGPKIRHPNMLYFLHTSDRKFRRERERERERDSGGETTLNTIHS